MKTFLALCLLSAGGGSVDAQNKLFMADFFSRDAEAAVFLCGKTECAAEQIQELVEISCQQSGPRVEVCFVEPIQRAKNMYIGVFARTLPATAYRQQFIFFGSGIGLINSTHLGVRDLRGREIGDGGTPSDYRYCWNGNNYVSDCPHGEAR